MAGGKSLSVIINVWERLVQRCRCSKQLKTSCGRSRRHPLPPAECYCHSSGLLLRAVIWQGLWDVRNLISNKNFHTESTQIPYSCKSPWLNHSLYSPPQTEARHKIPAGSQPRSKKMQSDSYSHFRHPLVWPAPFLYCCFSRIVVRGNLYQTKTITRTLVKQLGDRFAGTHFTIDVTTKWEGGGGEGKDKTPLKYDQ